MTKWLRVGAIGAFISTLLASLQGCSLEDSLKFLLILLALALPGSQKNVPSTFSGQDFIVSIQGPHEQDISIDPITGVRFIQKELLVALNGFNFQSAISFLENQGFTVKGMDERIDLYQVSVSQESLQALQNLSANLESDPRIRYATPTIVGIEYLVTPNDPSWRDSDPFNEWNLSEIQAPTGWDIETGDSKVSLAIVDGGFSYNPSVDVEQSHPDIDQNVDWGFLRSGGLTIYGEYNDHGTAVAGLAGARGNNSIGITGVCWECHLLPISISALQDQTHGWWWQVVQGIALAIGANAKVINLSVGPPSGWDIDAAVQMVVDLLKFVEKVRPNDFPLLVWSAGNSNVDIASGFTGRLMQYEQGRFADRMIVVGASSEGGNKASYSNFGSLVDVYAPGGSGSSVTGLPTFGVYSTSVLGTSGNAQHCRIGVSLNPSDCSDSIEVNGGNLDPINGFGYGAGTSFSAPLVTGLAGLLFSHDKTLTAKAVKTHILLGAVNGKKRIPSQPGKYIIDVCQALERLDGPPNSCAQLPLSNNILSCNNFSLSVTENSFTENDMTILNRCSDADSDTLVVSFVSNPAHGTTLKNGPNIKYTPDPNYSGSDSYQFRVTDGTAESNTATVSLTVNPVAPAPSPTANANGPYPCPQGSTVTLSSTGSSPPSGGSITQFTWDLDNNGSFETPGQSPVFNCQSVGTFTITLQVTDNNSGTDTAQTTVTVNAPSFSNPQITSFTLNNQSTAQLGDTITFRYGINNPNSTSTPITLGAQISLDGVNWIDDSSHDVQLTLVPGDNPNKSRLFTIPNSISTGLYDARWVIFEQGNPGNVYDTKTAADALTVVPVTTPPPPTPSDPPTAHAGGPYSCTIGGGTVLQGSATVVLGDTIQLYEWDLDGNGSFEATGQTPTFSCVSQGVFTVKLRVTDDDGEIDTDSSTVNVTVPSPTNSPPTCGSPNLETSRNTSLGFDIVNDGPTGFRNCHDPDGDAITGFITSAPSHGTVEFISATTLRYIPDTNYDGPDSFSFKATDGSAESNTGTANITVIATANGVPTCQSAGLVTTQNIALQLKLLSICTDPDGNDFFLKGAFASDPAHGTVSFVRTDLHNDTLRYVPDVDFSGLDTFQLRVTDGINESATALFSITVEPNDAPVADAGANQIVTDVLFDDHELVTLNGSASIDPDGSIVSYTWMWTDRDGPHTETTTFPTLSTVFTQGVYTVSLTVTDNKGAVGVLDTVVITINAPRPEPTGLVAEWSFEESSGLTAFDSSGNGHDAIIQNAERQGNGVAGNSLAVGLLGRAVAPSEGGLNLTAFTIEGWVVPRRINRFPDTNQGILSRYRLDTPDESGYMLSIRSGLGALDLSIKDQFGNTTGASSETSNVYLEQNTWQHVVGTFDGITAKVYVNGTLVGSQVKSVLISPNNLNLAIGAQMSLDGSLFNHLDGRVDELRVYNNALSDQEVLDRCNFNKPSLSFVCGGLLIPPLSPPSPSSSLIGEWTFDELSGNTALDSSGNNHNGTIVGATRVPGKVGGALEFTGQGGQYVDLGNDPALFPRSMTVSSWVKMPSFKTGTCCSGTIISNHKAGQDLQTRFILRLKINTNSFQFFANPDQTGGSGWNAVGHDTTAFSLQPNTWYHVVGVYDADNGEVKIYINGVLRGSGPASTSGIEGSTTSVWIGQYQPVQSNNFEWLGTIDEVRMYNKALSASAILAIFNSTP